MTDTSTPDFLPPGWQGTPPQGSPPAAPPDWPSAPPPPPKRGRQLAVVAIVTGIAVGAAAVSIPVILFTRGSSSSTTSGGSGPGPSSGSPGSNARAVSAYRQAIAATRASSGFHYVAVAGGAGDQKIVGDAGKDSGKQVITVASSYGAEQFTLLLVKGTVYFQGNAPALEDQLGVSAGKAPSLQGTWISVTSTDGPSTVLEPGITINDQAQETVLTPSSMSNVTTSGGHQAIRLSGAVPPVQGAPAGTGYLDIDGTTHLPIVYHTSITGNGVSLTDDVTFSVWGTAPPVSAPSGAVAWSTLGASEPPGGYGSGGSPGGGGSPSPTGQSF